MISFVEQFITALGLQTWTIPTVSVKEAYNPNKPDYPLITIDEMPSDTGITVDGVPRIVSNRYTIECYCRATDLTGSILTAKASARILGLEVNNYLSTTFNFSQVGDAICRPINEDNSVYRWIARYTTVIDENPVSLTKAYIYRDL